MTTKPYKDSRLAKYIERRILELKPRKSQAEIAQQVGYVNQNMITMIKLGSSKVALDRIPALASALETDPAFLMQLALEQSMPKTSAEAIVEVFGEPITTNEKAWLNEIRDVSGNTDPRLTSRSQSALRSIFGK